MSEPSKRHYARDRQHTLCGREISPSMKMTSDVNRITCIHCKGSPQLDGQLGNMTHTGH